MSTKTQESARSYRTKVGAIVSVAAIGVFAAACGGSSSTSTPSTGSSSGSAAATAPIILVAPLTGSNGLYTRWVNAVKAAVADVNANGGAGGHHLNLSVCDAGESA